MATLSALQFCMIANAATTDTTNARSVLHPAPDTPIMADPRNGTLSPETP
jgi:hypothetical protein